VFPVEDWLARSNFSNAAMVEMKHIKIALVKKLRTERIVLLDFIHRLVSQKN
jgi:hypothetical protein